MLPHGFKETLAHLEKTDVTAGKANLLFLSGTGAQGDFPRALSDSGAGAGKNCPIFGVEIKWILEQLNIAEKRG